MLDNRMMFLGAQVKKFTSQNRSQTTFDANHNHTKPKKNIINKFFAWKRTTRNHLEIVAVIMLICILVGTIYEVRNQYTEQSFSIFKPISSEDSRYTYYKRVLRKMGLKAKVDSVPINRLSKRSCYVMYTNAIWKEDEIDKLYEYVNAGGTLVLLGGSDTNSYDDYFDEELNPKEVTGNEVGEYILKGSSTMDTAEGVTAYKQGKGMVIYVPQWRKLSNDNLIDKHQRKTSYGLYKLLAQYAGKKRIIFNDRYLGVRVENSIYDVMSTGFRLFLITLVMIFALYICKRSVRFGRPEILYEEEEREVNEYISTASRMYKHSKNWDVVCREIKNCIDMKLFKLTRCSLPFEDTWRIYGLTNYNEAVSTYEALSKNIAATKFNQSEIVNLIHQAEKIIEYVDYEIKKLKGDI